MLVGSYYAGLAITTNFVGYIHAISHAIGACYGLVHGEINSRLMPLVLEQFDKAVHPQLADFSDWIGLEGRTQEEKAQVFIAKLKEFRDQFGISATIPELQKEDFPQLIQQAIAEANAIYPVPVIWTEKGFEAVLEQLLEN
ncbi:iron-containing alcohol dehydrogenase [Streptococcus gallinaceus]|uniref:Alcohol dehydrogenase class IV n=1 Tax=Streptococcus gallinaceus TaxID=165758 RepID=A0ABV2JHN5_9STRE|nr:iron-containing alcohol dehydrogenase [Streptococcus gallinaceus]MCP1640132.1 alcohol dehydrogenase class IV [Streptococcus gallinaceus]MCP1770914.1 alcohol dehydrogenase class IV [Streptococcus gallinaceus]